ncbi:UNVERIFIED_CONTAM: hypothetical protein FKN15_033017 [Acipenser sinensis]
MSLIAVLVFAVVFSAVDGGREVGVRCLIHDEDYTECTWKEKGRPDRNYTFQSRYRTGAEYAECPSYTQVEGYNVGCRLEYNSHMRFATFQVQLSSANNKAIWNTDIKLKPLVKLYSPVNLTVDNSSSNGLYLYWNTSMSKSQCLESIVRYRSSTDSAWQNSPAFTSLRYFNLLFPDAEELYEFQVKVRINEFCGTSDYWSDWSQPAYWGSNATSKGTSEPQSLSPISMQFIWVVMTLFHSGQQVDPRWDPVDSKLQFCFRLVGSCCLKTLSLDEPTEEPAIGRSAECAPPSSPRGINAFSLKDNGLDFSKTFIWH